MAAPAELDDEGSTSGVLKLTVNTFKIIYLTKGNKAKGKCKCWTQIVIYLILAIYKVSVSFEVVWFMR